VTASSPGIDTVIAELLADPVGASDVRMHVPA
jgi:hypothetical protein